MSVHLFNCRFRPGDRVRLGGDGKIVGVVEEVVMARGQTQPYYLVEWWHEGNVLSRRFLEEECVPA